MLRPSFSSYASGKNFAHFVHIAFLLSSEDELKWVNHIALASTLARFVSLIKKSYAVPPDEPLPLSLSLHTCLPQIKERSPACALFYAITGYCKRVSVQYCQLDSLSLRTKNHICGVKTRPIPSPFCRRLQYYFCGISGHGRVLHQICPAV